MAGCAGAILIEAAKGELEKVKMSVFVWWGERVAPMQRAEEGKKGDYTYISSSERRA
jgi:hypothetical protein